MSFIKPYSGETPEKLSEFISQSELCEMTLSYKSVVKSHNCCKSEELDGCIISIKGIPKIIVCDACLYKDFGELLELIHSPRAKRGCYFTVRFCEENPFVATYSSILLINKKMTEYFYFLFSRHIRDEMFYHSDKYQTEFVEKAKKRFKISDKEYRREKNASKGERKRFYNIKRISADLIPFGNEQVEIVRSSSQKGSFKIYVCSVVSDIPCQAACHSHVKSKNLVPSVLVITDKRDNGFTFSFCPEHLEQFARVLSKFMISPNLNGFSCGDFSLKKGRFSVPCYITDNTYRFMFKLHIGNRSVVLSKTALKKIAEKVLTSSVYCELFPIEAGALKDKFTPDEKLRNSDDEQTPDFDNSEGENEYIDDRQFCNLKKDV